MRRFLRSPAVRIVAALVVVGVFLHFQILRRTYRRAAQYERSLVGEHVSTDGVAVAVVWPDKSFVDGVTLAWEEMNAAKGPFAGKIRLRVFTERSARQAEDLAREVAGYSDVVAVLGHQYSDGVIPASVTYESHGLLFIVPQFSSPRLTSHGFQFLFRVTPDDRLLAHAMTLFAQQSGFKKVGVLYERNEQGLSAGVQLEEALTDAHMDVPFFNAYPQDDEHWYGHDFRPLVAQIRKEQFDAIALSGQLPHTAKLLVDLAKMGVTQPILATDDLDSVEIFQRAGASANNVFVASSVDPDSNAPAFVSFRDRFTRRFGVRPGYAATQGYEAFSTFVEACRLSEDAGPIVVATTLRTNTFKGLFGTFTFDDAGNVRGLPISIKRHTNGTFVTVGIE